LTVRISDHVKRLKDVVRLSDDEIAELKEIEKKQKNPYEKWADDRDKKLKKKVDMFPSFLKRDF
jgi:predicted translin family RNA/ssDNA-binding protein